MGVKLSILGKRGGEIGWRGLYATASSNTLLPNFTFFAYTIACSYCSSLIGCSGAIKLHLPMLLPSALLANCYALDCN